LWVCRYSIFILAVLRFELRATHLLGRCSTTYHLIHDASVSVGILAALEIIDLFFVLFALSEIIIFD
jgi:hypothetical protein